MTDTAATVDAAALERARRASDLGRTESWQALERTNFRDFALRQHRADYLASVRARVERAAAARAISSDAQPSRLDELTEAFDVTD
jgi:hypothetical protein